MQVHQRQHRASDFLLKEAKRLLQLPVKSADRLASSHGGGAELGRKDFSQEKLASTLGNKLQRSGSLDVPSSQTDRK